MVEIRADAFAEENAPETQEQKISIDELATLVANKVIEALKTEEKADEEEPEVQAEGEAEEQPETEENIDEPTEDKPDEDEPTEEQTEEENRSVDYSAFEERLAKIKKKG